MRTIQHYRGDTFVRDLAFTDSAGAPVNLTGSSIFFSIKAKFDDAVAIVSQAAVIVSAAAGTAKVTVPASVMENIGFGSYVYDFEWTDAGGVVRTIEVGTFSVEYDVTE